MEFLIKERLVPNLLQAVENGATVDDIIKIVQKAKPDDARPLYRAKWVKPRFAGANGFLTCSRCQNCYVEEEWVQGNKWNYCPNCGAIFEGVETDGKMDESISQTP